MANSFAFGRTGKRCVQSWRSPVVWRYPLRLLLGVWGLDLNLHRGCSETATQGEIDNGQIDRGYKREAKHVLLLSARSPQTGRLARLPDSGATLQIGAVRMEEVFHPLSVVARQLSFDPNARREIESTASKGEREAFSLSLNHANGDDKLAKQSVLDDEAILGVSFGIAKHVHDFADLPAICCVGLEANEILCSRRHDLLHVRHRPGRFPGPPSFKQEATTGTRGEGTVLEATGGTVFGPVR
jgi:hypothetical protein